MLTIVGVIAGLIFVTVTAGQWYILPLLGDAGVPLCAGSAIVSLFFVGIFGVRKTKKNAAGIKRVEGKPRRDATDEELGYGHADTVDTYD